LADYGFWRELAAEFRAMDTTGDLRADWHQTIKIGESSSRTADWRIVAASSHMRSISFAFQASARRGGMEIHPYMDSLTAWLEDLRSKGINHERGPIVSEVSPDGKNVATIYTGTISNVCYASADLCKIYESAALEIERLRRIKDESDRINGAQEIKDFQELPIEVKADHITFPNRAKWISDRLKEREWDWNHPSRFGGPDRKTVKKILAGNYVQIGAIGKLVTALNRVKKNGKTISILEVPND